MTNKTFAGPGLNQITCYAHVMHSSERREEGDTDHIRLVHIEAGLEGVADDEDEDHGGEEGGHGGVPAVAGAARQVVVHDGRAGDRLVDRQVEEGEQQHGDEHVDHAVAEADVEEGVVDGLPHGRRLVVGEVGDLGDQV